MRYSLFAFILLILSSTIHHLIAAPTDAQLEKIVALVANEQYAEAKAATEILLTVYPDDVQLTQILDSLSSALGKTSKTAETNDIQEPGTSSQALTGDDLLEFNTVVLSIQEAFNITDKSQRAARLRPLLERQVWPAAEVSINTQWLPYWKARALAAVDLEDPLAGPIAGHHLRRLGILNASDPVTMKLLAQLHQRDWLREFYGSAQIESIPPGAEISMNGQVLGHTPFTIQKLERDNSYRITLKAAGYLPQSHTWVAQGGETKAVKATLTSGKASVDGLKDYSINDIEYWIHASDTPSAQMGGTTDDNAFRIANAKLAYAKMGDYEKSIEVINTMQVSGVLNENLHSYFLRSIGAEMLQKQEFDKCLGILPSIKGHWHRRELARALAETAGESGNSSIAQNALDIAFNAQEASVSETGGGALDPLNRAQHFRELAYSAHKGRVYGKDIEYMQRSESFARSVSEDNRAWVWVGVGTSYALFGYYEDTERSLQEITSGNVTTASLAFLGWKTSAKNFADNGDRASGLRLLASGRKTLQKAGRRFKTIEKESIARELADSCLEDSEFVRHVKAEAPEAALAAYQASGMALRYNSEDFDSILNLFLEQKKLRHAEKMLKDPVLGFYSPPNNQEDIKETETTLAYSRGKLAAAILINEGLEAQQDYLRTLEQTPLLLYMTYRETAYLLAAEYQKRES